MPDLFDLPLLPGLRLQGGFITHEEDVALIAAIDTLEMVPFQFHQWTGKRQVKSFGWSYDFQTHALDRSEPVPDWLIPVRDRAAVFARVQPAELVQALLIRYGPGAGIGWHTDRPVYEQVLGISLGAPADMRFRRRRSSRWERVAVALEPGSIYLLSGEVRHEWEHSIIEMQDATRYSITFRTFSALGQRVTAGR